MVRAKCITRSILTLVFLFYSCLIFANTDFLPVDQAFKLNAVLSASKKEAEINFKVAPGYYLYQQHIQILSLDNKSLTESAILPKPIMKKNKHLGDYGVYANDFSIVVPLAENTSAKSSGFRIEYQGCAESGFCYPPQTKQIDFSKAGVATIQDIDPDAAIPSQTGATESVLSESDQIAGFFTQKSFPLTLLAFLSIGVLLAFTPCVLPMVPILANILIGQKEPHSKKRSIALACLYVFSMAACYAVAGLVAGLLGNHLQASLQQPHILTALACLIFMFALNQMNMLHFEFPAFITGFFSSIGANPKQGSIFGAVSMGCVSALVVSPCVTPALVGALTYIGQTGDAVLGGFALFTLAFGMGLPLLIVASIGSHLLPKAGSWMTHIKTATGVLLLFLAGSIFMRAMPSESPVLAQAHSSPGLTQVGYFTTIKSTNELSEALAAARQSNKPVILDVTADWCVSCRQMDKEIFQNEKVMNNLKDVSLLRIDLTHPTPAITKLIKQLEIIGPPMVLFFKPDGQELRSHRAAGKIESQNFLDRVQNILSQAE